METREQLQSCAFSLHKTADADPVPRSLALVFLQDWKNILAPVQLVCEKVSRAQVQQTYSLIFPQYKEIGADELLNSYARMRSFYKDHGRPDEAHAARIILKDFCSGKLLSDTTHSN